jgi:molybdopterin synthase catalytic subunit
MVMSLFFCSRFQVVESNFLMDKISHFSISDQLIHPDTLRESVLDPSCGGFVSFEGWVRNHHNHKDVLALEYEAYTPLAEKEGERIIRETFEKFSITKCAAIHRVGKLNIGELAVVVAVSSSHRQEAFAACQYVIDEIKNRVPIWKKEYYTQEEPQWVLCSHDHDHHA